MPSTVGIVASQVFTPLDLAPALWLDASDAATITSSSGSVSQWNDKSGNARNFTQATAANQPVTGTRTLNSLNVIDFTRGRFVDAGDVMDLGTNAWSSFSVFKFDDTNTSAPYGKHIAGSTDGRYGVFRDGGLLYGMYDSDPTATGAVTVSDSSTSARYISTVLTRNGASSKHVIRVSGSETVKTFTDVSTSWNTTAPWRVGRYGTSTAADFDGYIAEIVVVLRTATDSEVTLMESYLKSKWGL